jgi:hypothetical protein
MIPVYQQVYTSNNEVKKVSMKIRTRQYSERWEMGIREVTLPDSETSIFQLSNSKK